MTNEKILSRTQIEAWAKANYDKSYFASTIIECWDDDDFEDIDMKFLLELEGAVNEQCNAARCDMY